MEKEGEVLGDSNTKPEHGMELFHMENGGHGSMENVREERCQHWYDLKEETANVAQHQWEKQYFLILYPVSKYLDAA